MSAVSVLNLAVDVTQLVLWGSSLVIFARVLWLRRGIDRNLRLLVAVLALDAGRTVVEAAFFGSAHLDGGVLPAGVANPLTLMFPGLLTTASGIAVLFLIARGWMPGELSHRDAVSRQLRDTNLRLRRLIEHAPDAIYIHDAAGRILDCNEVACGELGYRRDELVAMHIADVEVSYDPGQLDAIWGRLADGETMHLEGRHRRHDGTTFPVAVSLAATTMEGGPTLFTAICRNVSDPKRQQQALQRAVADLSQANAKVESAITAKNNFLESVSYRLRTPLNTILGLSEMISDGACVTIENEKITEYLDDIHAAGHEVLKVVDELSSVASAEAAVGADQRSYRTIIEMSPDSICLCRDGRVTFINAAGLRLLGCNDAREIDGQPLAQYVHPDYRMLCDDNFAALISEAAATPMKFLHPSGKVLDVLVSAAAAPEGDDSVLVVVRNISDLMRATRDVAAQAKRLNSILDTAVDAIVVSDEAGRIETFNRAAEVMFRYSAKDVIGRNISILMNTADGSEHGAHIERYLTAPLGQIGSGREVTARRKDGSTFPAEITLSVCHLDDRRLFTAMIRDVTERRNFENHLAHSATHDSLTGLPNRRLLEERVEQAVDQAARDLSWVAVWFIDLDGFKMVNDVMGHAAGDELLIEAGRRIAALVKPGDTVARFGGDEFTVVVTDVQKKSEVVRAVEHFFEALSRPFLVGGREVTLTANIGISLYPEHAMTASDLILHASAAMMFAKATGRNLFRFYDPLMHRQSAERLTLENELRRGIERDELMLAYQPQVEVKTGRVIGLEALVRWNHPTMGVVSPARFIPIAEQTGLIVPLGEWVLRQACKDLRRLEDKGIDITIAINISARQFNDVDMLSVIHNVIEETGINPAHLDVEITESMLMHDPEHVIAYLERMKSLGIRLSIDDFGTGYSSLNYLKRFPVNTLKIDRSFITDIAHNPKDEAIAVTIITLAHSMGMTVLAEGVEYTRQVEILRSHGCDMIQGFLYSKPLSLDHIVAQLEKGAVLPAAVPVAAAAD